MRSTPLISRPRSYWDYLLPTRTTSCAAVAAGGGGGGLHSDVAGHIAASSGFKPAWSAAVLRRRFVFRAVSCCRRRGIKGQLLTVCFFRLFRATPRVFRVRVPMGTRASAKRNGVPAPAPKRTTRGVV